jgi:hypothetical protein
MKIIVLFAFALLFSLNAFAQNIQKSDSPLFIKNNGKIAYTIKEWNYEETETKSCVKPGEWFQSKMSLDSRHFHGFYIVNEETKSEFLIPLNIVFFRSETKDPIIFDFTDYGEFKLKIEEEYLVIE